MFSRLDDSKIEGIEVHANRFTTLFNFLKKPGHDLLEYRITRFDDDLDLFLERIEDLKVSEVDCGRGCQILAQSGSDWP